MSYPQVSSGGESGRISMADINPSAENGEEDPESALAYHNQMILTNPEYAKMFMAQMAQMQEVIQM
jgi:hypothetical protein